MTFQSQTIHESRATSVGNRDLPWRCRIAISSRLQIAVNSPFIYISSTACRYHPRTSSSAPWQMRSWSATLTPPIASAARHQKGRFGGRLAGNRRRTQVGLLARFRFPVSTAAAAGSATSRRWKLR